MNWGYPVFLIILGGFGVVYLAWPDNRVLAAYGYFATNSALLLTCLAFHRATHGWKGGGWPFQASRGLAVGFWIWLAAGVADIVQSYLNRAPYGGVADFLWILGYLPMYLGLYPRFQESIATGKTRMRLLLLLLAAGYAVMFYLYVVPHLLDPDRALPAKILDVLYAALNFLLLAIILSIARSFGKNRHPLKPVFRFFVTATVIMLFSDLMLSYYSDRESFVFQLLDIPYFALYFIYFHGAQEMARAAGAGFIEQGAAT